MNAARKSYVEYDDLARAVNVVNKIERKLGIVLAADQQRSILEQTAIVDQSGWADAYISRLMFHINGARNNLPLRVS